MSHLRAVPSGPTGPSCDSSSAAPPTGSAPTLPGAGPRTGHRMQGRGAPPPHRPAPPPPRPARRPL